MKATFTLLLFILFYFNTSGQCLIDDLVAESYTCDSLNQFLVDVDFEFAGVTDSFELRGNGMSYGFFSYDNLPVTIGPLDGDCETNYEVVVIDKNLPECNADIGLGVICCDSSSEMCAILNLVVEVSDCNDEGEVNFTVNFDVVNPESNGFTVVGNGMNYGSYTYASLPIIIGPIEPNCDIEYELVVFDNESEACNAVAELGEICCAENCEIGALEVDLTDCDDAGNIYAVIDFEFVNPVSSNFEVAGNGNNYGTFAYSSLPVTVGPIEADCVTELELVVYDEMQESCISDIGLGVICCGVPDCFIGEVEVNFDCSDDGTFMPLLSFEYEATSDSFIVQGNGNNYGTFSYGQLPVTLDSLVGDCVTEYEFVVIDQEQEDCSNFIDLGVVCCSDTCGFGSLIVETTNCSESEQFFIEVDLEESTVEAFTISVNGEIYDSFVNDDLPIILGPYDGDCETLYVIQIVDDMNESCFLIYTQEPICCNPCELSEMTFEYDCNENSETFDISLNFEYTGTSDSFYIVGNGNNYGTYAYMNLPIVVFDLVGDCALEYEFIAIDQDDEACKTFVEVGEVCCVVEECFIGEIEYELECVGEEFFEIVINFEYANTGESFSIFGNGNQYGSFDYSDLPINLNELLADCDTEYAFEIIDDETDACFGEIEVGEVCCDVEECFIGEVEYELECIDEEFFELVINFEYENTGESFSIFGNGNNYGSFNYSDLPISLNELSADCETEYAFEIFDDVMDSCSVVIELGEVCCTAEECSLGEIIIETECTSTETYDLFFDLGDYESVSDSFQLFSNGFFVGTFAYSSLPGIIPNLPANCELELEFLLVDSENEACFSELEFGPICCEEDCSIDITGITGVDCIEGEASMQIDFVSENIMEPGVEIAINGDIVSTVEAGSESVLIDGIVSEEPTLTITICQAENNEACCDEITIENPCFMDFVTIGKLTTIDWIYYHKIGQLDNQGEADVHYTVLNYSGLKIMDGIVRSSSIISLDMNDLISGLYMIHLSDGQAQRTHKFFVH